jgi:RimJ/RimL family protein N-acetyltransferase
MGDFSEHLSKFVPTKEKVDDLIAKLQGNKLYLSDENREYETALAVVFSHLYGGMDSCLFEIGEWRGLMGVVNIVPGWKGDLFFKLWDQSAWGPSLRRELGEAIDHICEKYRLERVALSTPDANTARLAENYGFIVEGILKNSFRWGGVSYDTICLGLDRRN